MRIRHTPLEISLAEYVLAIGENIKRKNFALAMAYKQLDGGKNV